MSEMTSLNLQEYEKHEITPELQAEMDAEFRKESFWAKRIPQRLKEKVAAGLMVGMSLMGPSMAAAQGGGGKPKEEATISSSTTEREWHGHWNFFVRGDDGRPHFNPYSIIFPGQFETSTETTESKKAVFELPYEYSRLFDTGKALNPEDHQKIADYIDQKLRQEFADKVSMYGFGDFDENGVYRTHHPKESDPKLRVTSMSITGSSSPEGPQAKGPDTLKPGSVDAENLNLAIKRAETAMGLTEESLKKLGITAEQLENSAKMISGREIQFNDAEMSELVDLALMEDGADPLEKIFHLTIKYNDYKEAKTKAVAEGKDPTTVTDSYLDPMMDRLDDIIGSKRKVRITIKYEEDQKNVVLMPVTWLVFIPLLKLRKRRDKEETEPNEPSPEVKPPKPDIPAKIKDTDLPSRDSLEYQDMEERASVDDLYEFFENSDAIRRGLDYKAIADSVYYRYEDFEDDQERENFLAMQILQAWRAHDLAARREAGVSEESLEAGLDYDNNDDQIKWAKMHARALLNLIKLKRNAENGEDIAYLDLMEPGVQRLILRRTLRNEGPVPEVSEAETTKTAETAEQVSAKNSENEKLITEIREVNEQLVQLKRELESLRATRNPEDFKDDERRQYQQARDKWREKKEGLISLLDNLPDESFFSVDLAPPAEAAPTSGTDTVTTEEPRIKPDDFDRPGTVEPRPDTGLNLPMAGRDHTNMTMEEIDYMIFNAKATGKDSPGVADEGLAFWEDQKRLKKEAEKEAIKQARAEAKRIEAERKEAERVEALERRAKELKDEIDKLVTRLSQRRYYLNDEVLPGLTVAKNTARSIEQAHWQDEKEKTEGEIKSLVKEVKELEKELEKIEKGMGKPFKSALRSSFDKAKEREELETVGPDVLPAAPESVSAQEGTSEKSSERTKSKFKSVWSWTKERVKSILKDGGLVIGEVRQAEMLRKGTNVAASNTEAMATLVKTEWNIDNPDAVQEIANEALKLEKKTGLDLREGMEKVSRDRKNENDSRKDYIIKTAIEDLKANLVIARGQATSETVLTPENLAQVEAEMRTELNKLSDAALVKDAKAFAKVMRDNLDKYWWLRYLYAGTELGALGWLGYQLLNSGDTVTLPNVDRPKMFIPEDLAPHDVSGDTRLMLDHYWGVAKNLWAENGVPNPTDSQIMEVDKILARDNNVAVPEWGIEGDRLHTKLPVHWVLVKGGIALIRASLGS